MEKEYIVSQIHKVEWRIKVKAKSDKDAIEKSLDLDSGWKEHKHIHAQSPTIVK